MTIPMTSVRGAQEPVAAERVTVTLEAAELAQLTRYLGGSVGDERIHPVVRAWMRSLYERLASGACDPRPERPQGYRPLEDVRFRGYVRLLASIAADGAEQLGGSRDPFLRHHAGDLRDASAYITGVLATGTPPVELLEGEAA